MQPQLLDGQVDVIFDRVSNTKPEVFFAFLIKWRKKISGKIVAEFSFAALYFRDLFYFMPEAEFLFILVSFAIALAGGNGVFGISVTVLVAFSSASATLQINISCTEVFKTYVKSLKVAALIIMRCSSEYEI